MVGGIVVTYMDVLNGQFHFQFHVDFGTGTQANGDYYTPVDGCTYQSCKDELIAQAVTSWEATNAPETVESGSTIHIFGFPHDTATT